MINDVIVEEGNMDGREVMYKDHFIRDWSYENSPGQWLPRAFISEPSERGTTEYPPLVPLPEGITFLSLEEAMGYSFHMAKSFVDRR